MLSFDLMTSPPNSTSPSPSLASLARIPSLSPSYIAPVPRRATDNTFAVTPTSPPPRSPGCIPASLPLPREQQDRALPDLPLHPSQARGSHSEVMPESPSMTFEDTDLYAARLPRPSLPASVLVPILNVTVGHARAEGRPGTQTRKPSFKIPLPLANNPAQPSLASLTADLSRSRPSLAVSYGSADENESRRSSFTRTPYPLDEADDYMSSGGDIRRVHPCDKGMQGEEGVKWVDPWAAVNEASPLRTPEEGDGTMEPPTANVGKVDKAAAVKPKVGSVDVCNWASVGMEQAWSADSQSAAEGDSLLLEG